MVRVYLALLPISMALGCQMTPDEINRVQVENSLLREQIQIIRENCSYYRELELEAEEATEQKE